MLSLDQRHLFHSWVIPPYYYMIWTYFIVYIHIQKVWTQVLTTYEVLTLLLYNCISKEGWLMYEANACALDIRIFSLQYFCFFTCYFLLLEWMLFYMYMFLNWSLLLLIDLISQGSLKLVHQVSTVSSVFCLFTCKKSDCLFFGSPPPLLSS